MSTASPKSKVKLKGVVGETVVYAAHGVGKIVAREQTKVDGTDRDSVVVNLATGLQVTLPHADAMERLRPVAGAERPEGRPACACLGTAGAHRTLDGAPPRVQGQAHRQPGHRSRGARPRRRPVEPRNRLSPAEHDLYSQARALLVPEVLSPAASTKTGRGLDRRSAGRRLWLRRSHAGLREAQAEQAVREKRARKRERKEAAKWPRRKAYYRRRRAGDGLSPAAEDGEERFRTNCGAVGTDTRKPG